MMEDMIGQVARQPLKSHEEKKIHQEMFASLIYDENHIENPI